VQCPQRTRSEKCIFIRLVKFKEKPTKEMIEDNSKRIEQEVKEGITIFSAFGRSGDMTQSAPGEPRTKKYR
jgi:hypothetical protein